MRNSNDRRNTLTVGIVAGLLGGLILSMILQVFDVGELKDVPVWLQGISGVFATLVSVYAVFLVSQTLQATRRTLDQAHETLKITQLMADDQKAIGDAQTRAWVYMSHWDFIDHAEGLRLKVYLKNYGTTPAREIKGEGYFDLIKLVPVSGKLFKPESDTLSFAGDIASYPLPPGKDAEYYTLSIPGSFQKDWCIFLRFTYTYKTIHSDVKINQSYSILVKAFGEDMPKGK